MTRLPWSLLAAVLVVVAFMGSCIGFLPLAGELSDSSTLRPVVDKHNSPYFVLIVEGDTARIIHARNPRDLGPPPSGASYLVPAGREKAIQRYLTEHDPLGKDGAWMVRTKPLAADRQRIDLYWLSDGYAGSVYEATAMTIAPLHRRLTGPGHGIVVSQMALMMNVGLWAVLLPTGWWIRRRLRHETHQPPAPSHPRQQ